MRALITVIGILLIILGAVWILQGVNVLPGSFMTGDIHWAIYGAIAVVAGIILIAVSRRRRPQPPSAPPPPAGPPPA
jgi:uncharacterized membrane protein HdeD (DUF308 family)